MKQEVFLEGFKGSVKFGQLLKERTSIGIGGPARFWAEPEGIEDLCKIFLFAGRENLNIFIIGEGTNLLVSDTGFDGIVVNLNASCFKGIYNRDDILFAGAGVKLEALRRQAEIMGLGGLEFLAGIPGSVGGALIMNAGVRDFDGRRVEIGNVLLEAEVLDNLGNVIKLKRDELKFDYRWSNLEGYVVLSAGFKLNESKNQDIAEKTKHFFEKRIYSQDLKWPSAGCVFKNPSDNQSAGWLLDKCGLKGKRIGDAQISEIHANFIINLGNATFNDIFSLIELARQNVKENFGIGLELELKVLK